MENDYSVILITGAARTGTTLLGSVLASSPMTEPLPPESGFLLELIRSHRVLGKLVNSYLREERERLADEIITSSIKKIIDEKYNKYKKEYIVLRLPAIIRNIREVRKLINWTDVKTICCLRDPRDAVLSLLDWDRKQIDSGSKKLLPEHTVEQASIYFMSYYNLLLERMNTDDSYNNILFIKYEELVTNPYNIAKEIQVYTGIDLAQYRPDAEWVSTELDYNEERKNNVAVTDLYGKSVSDEHIKRYRDNMNIKEKALVESICEKYMNTFFYPFSTTESERNKNKKYLYNNKIMNYKREYTNIDLMEIDKYLNILERQYNYLLKNRV